MALGALVSTAAVAVYLLSRSVGLPELPRLPGWRDYPVGTVALGLGVVFLGLHFTVLSELAPAHPNRRDWHD